MIYFGWNFFFKVSSKYFRICGQKTTFSKWSRNNDIFLEILIISDLRRKENFFSKLCQKTCFTLKCLKYRFFQNGLKKCRFCRYVNIFGSLDLKITTFSSIFSIWYISAEIFFSKWAQNIFGFMGKKRLYVYNSITDTLLLYSEAFSD